MTKTNKILDYLDSLYPNARCELNYTKDYELLLAVMMSAQTTDIRVNQVTAVLYKKYPNLEDYQTASLEDIMEIIRPIGTFRKKAQNIKEIVERLINEQNGVVPNDREFLESLPGVGRKTANVVLSNLFNVPCVAVDTHVERVSKRLGLVKIDDKPLEIERKLTKKFPREKLIDLHHQLVLFGRYRCKARGMDCKNCGLIQMCQEKNKNL